MKNKWILAVVIGIVALLGLVSVVGAQGTTPTATPGTTTTPAQKPAGRGLLHDYMEAEIAKAFGLTVDELEAKQAEGVTFLDLAEEKDLSVAEARQIWTDARSAALDKAVADGVITQAQADLMKERGGQMGGRMMGGGRGMGGGCMGDGLGDGTTGPRGRMGGRGGSW